ncbi:MAG TPA: glutamate--cysteine ligase [Coriobacteriia bacterium]|nr:glutamate--cysteine ligase [Coriobacteriia bacterium]
MDYNKTVQEPDEKALAEQIRAISDYMKTGIGETPHGPNRKSDEHIGLELEHFIVRRSDGSPVPYEEDLESKMPGVRTVLERLAPFYDNRSYESQPDGTRCLIGLSRSRSNITLEPGAQLEVSIGPMSDLAGLETQYRRFRSELDQVLQDLDLAVAEMGYHPSARAGDIPLIPKGRYRFMDRHFETTGRHGICMMRATASTQVSIDFHSEEDAIRKFRIAGLLSPLLAFVTDNSPVFENAPIASKGNTRPKTTSGLPVPDRMVRTVIWDDVDADRSKTMPGTFDDCLGFESYAQTLLQMPAIFSFGPETDDSGKDPSYLGNTTFAEVLDGKIPDRADIEHILSLFFFDVRLKTYVEIRAADALPIEYALAYAALIKGIFYNDEALLSLEHCLGEFDIEDIDDAKEMLRFDGYDAIVYKRPAEQWLDELIYTAADFLEADERPYLEPLVRLIAERKTPVDLA